MIRHFAKKFPPKSFRLALLQFNLVFQLLGLLLPLFALPAFVIFLFNGGYNLQIMSSYLISISWVWATVPALLYAERESPLKALWAFAVGIFNLFALSWICAYSWITMRNSKWMTRELRNKEETNHSAATSRLS